MSSPVTVALFDLDRTLVTRDTASLYIRFERELGEASALDVLKVAGWMALYTLGVLDVERVAQNFARGYQGKPESVMVKRGQDCFVTRVHQHIPSAARQTVEEHRRQGHLLAIVTSGTPYIARPLAAHLGIEHVLHSAMEVQDGHYTGRMELPLCYGPGKLVHVQQFATQQGFLLEDACFYTDSITDLPLLGAVKVPVAINPDARLRRHALRNKWQIQTWR